MSAHIWAESGLVYTAVLSNLLDKPVQYIGVQCLSMAVSIPRHFYTPLKEKDPSMHYCSMLQAGRQIAVCLGNKSASL